MVKEIHEYAKTNDKKLSLMITPTTDCNFRCVYCYEEGIKKSEMTVEIQNNIIEYIRKKSDVIKQLFITWYGGEPLLKLDIIKSMSLKIMDICREKNIEYKSSIISNGYLLNEKTANELIKYNIESVQITVDGIEKHHNEKRFLHNGSGTFSKIIDNIKSINNILSTEIRVNLDLVNMESFDAFLDLLEKEELKEKISIYTVFINPTQNYISNCLDKTSHHEEILIITKKIIEKGFSHSIQLIQGTGICGGLGNSYFVIDSDGNFYKCPVQIGDKKEIVGDSVNGLNFDANYKWNNHNIFDNDECLNCNVFPLCRGGCPDKKFNDKEKNCSDLKYNLKEYIKLSYKKQSINKEV